MKRFAFTALALVALLPLSSTAQAQHVSTDIIAEYNFEEGAGATVGDTSGFGTPLNLDIADTGSVTWGSGYLSIDSPTVITHNTPNGVAADPVTPATKIISAVVASGEISIEAVIKPADNTQGGAARIVNIGTINDTAAGPVNRNVFLAQNKTKFDARLRSSTSNNNGSGPSEVKTSAVVEAAPELIHVLFTRGADGNSFIYINGVQDGTKSIALPDDLTNWDAGYGLSIANEQSWKSGEEGNRNFEGEIHHVSIYSRALSGAEAAQNAESFGLGAVPEPTSMVLVGLGMSLFATVRRRKLA